MTQDTDHEARIRERAYALWEDAGKPEGGAENYWYQAEREIGTQPAGGPQKRSRNGATASARAPDEGPAGAAPAAKKAKPARRPPTTKETGKSSGKSAN